MLPELETRRVREAVGIFNCHKDIQHAIDELVSSGFHRSQISLLASEWVCLRSMS
jgi:hypothetical protein